MLKKRVLALLLSLTLVAVLTVPVYAADTTLTSSMTVQELGEGSTTVLTVHLNTDYYAVKTVGVKIVFDSDDILIKSAESLIKNTSVSWYDDENHNYIAMLSSEGKYNGDILRLTISIKTASIKTTKITLIPSLKNGKTTIDCNKAYAVLTLTGHSPSETVIENYLAASCENDGGYDEVAYCDVCGEELSREHKTIIANGHKWNEGVVTIAATCTENGVRTYTCNYDEQHTYTEVIPATGHTPSDYVRENEKAPTCEVDGFYDEVVYCSVCQTELSREKKTITAPGHNYVPAVTDPRCTEQGYTTYTCSECQYSYVGSYTNPLGHNYAASVTNPTCTERGYTTYTCTRCGDSYVDDYKDPLGHDWNEGVITTPATCTSDGIRTYTCSRDGNHTFEETVKSPGHLSGTPVQENVVDSTHLEDGSYDEVVYCSVCHTELSREKKTITAPGHNYVPTVTNSTCTEQGYTTHTCSECQDSYVDNYTESLGHSWNSGVITTPATCTATGVRTYTCVRDAKHTYEETIPALGHVPASAVIENRVEPTCTVPGSYDEVVYCSVCRAEISRDNKTIQATRHTPASAVIENHVEPTRTQDGRYDSVVYCSICYEEISRDTIVIPHPVENITKFSDGKWYYTVNGKKDLTFTGFASNSSGRYRIEKGVVNFKYTDIVKDEDEWRYYSGGKWQKGTTSVEKRSNGTWWYVKNGVVQFGTTGLVKRTENNTWWYVKGGQVQFNFTGFADNGSRYRVEKGQVNFKYTDVVKDGSEWRYYSGGKWQTGVTSVEKRSNGTWWYVKNGVVQFGVTDVVKRTENNTWWFVKGGQVQTKLTSVVKKSDGSWWYVKNGQVQTGATGVVKRADNNTWWYVKGGKLQFNFTGIAKMVDASSKWYVKDGKVQTGYSGKIKISGKTYTISKGKVK